MISYDFERTKWTKEVNMLLMVCGICSKEWFHRVDRSRVVCKGCGNLDNLHEIRDRIVYKLQ